MKVVAFVPIKLNSQRLPHKNILPIAGHPMCWHVCNTLKHVKCVDEVYVYCSDPAVKEFIPKEVKFLQRPEWLDGDLIKGFDIYREFIKTVDADVYVLTHTTSPFIKAESIKNALGKVITNENDSAFSAERIQTFVWYEENPVNYNLNDVPRTQDLKPVWKENSAFYIFQKDIFVKHQRRIGFNPYIQEVSGIEAIDIDEKKDYDFACFMAKMEGLEDE